MRRRSSAQSLALRSRIVLECAEGRAIAEVARRLRVTTGTVRTWRRRLLERRLDGLCDEPRPGVPPPPGTAPPHRLAVIEAIPNGLNQPGCHLTGTRRSQHCRHGWKTSLRELSDRHQ
ncbi:helix-turn-helix domain-containing protein [Streptomyces sp. NPDC002835]